jgi:hypothetical protein
MIIGYTGTQAGMSDRQMSALYTHLSLLHPGSEFHHGDCIGGDEEAHGIAMSFGLRIVIHPPINSRKRAFCKGAAVVLEPKDYIPRNHDIVDAIELLIAAPKTDGEELRSGTWATVRYARKGNKQRLLLTR